MKKRWVVLAAIALSLCGVLFAIGSVRYWIATHTGPFAYFQANNASLSTDELISFGTTQINTFFSTPKTDIEAVQFLKKLVFSVNFTTDS